MLQEPMMEKLLAMRLNGMADALKAQEQDPGARELSFLERLAYWSITSGTGDRTRRWRVDSMEPNYVAMPVSKRSTTARREGWTKA